MSRKAVSLFFLACQVLLFIFIWPSDAVIGGIGAFVMGLVVATAWFSK